MAASGKLRANFLSDDRFKAEPAFCVENESQIRTLPTMPNDDWDDEEDWSDDPYGDDSEDDETVPCPECRRPVSIMTDKCPTCGYWLTDADRQSQPSLASNPLWLRITAALIILACLISLLMFRHSLF